jgi:hypothetical protein
MERVNLFDLGEEARKVYVMVVVLHVLYELLIGIIFNPELYNLVLTLEHVAKVSISY